MPELPEVETARALVARRGLEREISAVDDTDSYVCRPFAPGEIADALTGTRLVTANRRGKSMWFETERGPVLGLHLGMAGRIYIDEDSAGDPVKYSKVETGRPVNPVWARFTLEFADGGSLVLFDKRRLGRAVLDPDLSALGPDALEITQDEFRERVGRGEAPLKARIMDQSVLAGVGNLLADEVLWQARQPPLRPAGDLDEEELDELREELLRCTRRAMELGGVHHGEVIPFRAKEEVCPRCGGDMVKAQVGGRTTWWCSEEQAWPRR